MKKTELKTQDPTPVEKKILTVPEVIENLKIQLSQYQTMVVKTQGALEVLTQIEDNNGESYRFISNCRTRGNRDCS